MKLTTLQKLFRDPFVLLIAVVVLVPAVLVAYSIASQASSHTAVNSVSQEAAEAETSETGSSSTATPQPITQAEQPVIEEKQPVAEPAPQAAVCDQTKKQAAESTKATQISQENAQHERQKDKLRAVTKVYRRYWDDEKTRHDNALNQIEATYRASLAAANC